MEVTMQDGKIIIIIPVNRPPIKSKTGKTLSVASSRGNKVTSVEVDGQNLIVGVNAYIYANKR